MQVSPNRQALFAPILSRLRLLMISKMAKPEEVSTLACRCIMQSFQTLEA